MGTIETLLKSVSDAQLADDVVEEVDAVRVAMAPVERKYKKFQIGKQALLVSIIAALTGVVALILAFQSTFAAVPVAIGALGFTLAAAGQVVRFRAMTELWNRWPVDATQAMPTQYRNALSLARLNGSKWRVATNVCFALVALVFCAWAMSEGESLLGAFAFMFAGGIAWAAKAEIERESAIRLGTEARAQVEADGGEVIRGLVALEAVTDQLDDEPVAIVPDTIEILWRGQISKTGSVTTTTSSGVVEEKAPQDVMAVTTHGIHMLNIMEPAQPWDTYFGVTDAATAQTLKEGFAQINSFRDFIDWHGRKLDDLVSAHGYAKVVAADPRNLVFPRSSIATAGLYKRRFVPSYFFELGLVGGRKERRDVVAGEAERDELARILLENGYVPAEA